MKFLSYCIFFSVLLLCCSCTAGLVIGHNQRQHQENNISTKIDSTRIYPTITIR